MDSGEQPFDVSNTPEYMKTYIGVLTNTLVETIYTATDAKTRVALLDSVCRQQKQQLDVANETIKQSITGLKASNDTLTDLNTQLEHAREEVASRLNEVRTLSVFEEKYKAAINNLETVTNNYNATKSAYEDLLKKYGELEIKYSNMTKQTSADLSSAGNTTVIASDLGSKPRKKQKPSEDTGWE